jgi:capsular polysaccharide biosynthesis protein
MSQNDGAGGTGAADVPERYGDGDRTVTIPRVGDDPPAGGWADGDFTVVEDPPAVALGVGLASPPFIAAALRRRAWLWCLTAVIGLVAGFAFTVVHPPPYKASTSILLAHSADENPADAILTDVAMAQSQTVAGGAMRKLGLRQSISSFLATYTVTEVTDRLIRITVSGPSNSEAVARARALATEFLQFRANELQTAQNGTVARLHQQIAQTTQQVAELSSKVAAARARAGPSAAGTPPAAPGTLPAPIPSPGRSLSHAQKELIDLEVQLNQAQLALDGLKAAASSDQVTKQHTIDSMVAGSRVLVAAAPVHSSRLRHAILYSAAGLFAGLALGVGIVIAQALVSVRLRRRDDVAGALGAPVDLSVGSLRARRLPLPGRRSRGRDQRRMVAHLRDAVPPRSRGAATLAVVAVDNAQAVAPSLVALAMACAREGKQVVVADLAGGAPAAHLLGVGKPGIRPIQVNGAHLVVAVPGRDNMAPVGPVPPASPQAPLATASEALTAAYASADLLLTLVTLDPALGGDHLATWATGAVVVVTAGQSSWTRIHAVGEMIRLAGTSLVSTVLTGADKTDESLGAAYTPASRRRPTPVGIRR